MSCRLLDDVFVDLPKRDITVTECVHHQEVDSGVRLRPRAPLISSPLKVQLVIMSNKMSTNESRNKTHQGANPVLQHQRCAKALSRLTNA